MASSVNLDKLFGQIGQIKVGIIGDVMLDTYWWGHVERISPEAPVPVVSLDRREYRMGGAGNVALNAASLGAKVSVLSVTGDDDDAVILNALLSDKMIKTTYLFKSDQRITTTKTRIISKNQHMMRLDAETTMDLSSRDENKLLAAINKYVKNEKPAVIILEDYNKGVLTEKIIATVISICKKNDVIVAVDPKQTNFFAYQHADIFKPNLKEVKEGLNLSFNENKLSAMKDVHRRLTKKLNHAISLITLSEKGVFYQNQNQAKIIPSHVRNIADVSGAGDTVIATASLVYAATRNIHLMAEIANVAGGMVCEEVGTVAIDKHRLIEECKLLLESSREAAGEH
jgi:rfaE bifunctional protein kinase chain/domain